MRPNTQDEWLACRAQAHDFPADPGPERRGIISYYAARTLPAVRTVNDWLHAIQRAAGADLASGTLPFIKQPHLQVLGNPAVLLPGHPAP